MRVQAFERLIQRGKTTRRVLRHLRYQNGRIFCHACRSRRVYRLAEGRYRCRGCRYTFGLLTGTWLGQARIAWPTWLWWLKLFELEVTAHHAARQTGVSYPTALRVFTTIRRAIVAQEAPGLLQREVEADESYFGGTRKGGAGVELRARFRSLASWNGRAACRSPSCPT